LHKKRLGKIGETLACEYLLNHHYTIVERNFQKRYGELDIIAVKDKILVFVEVKTGTSKLNNQQKNLKETIQKKRVRWEEYNPTNK